jgi:nucleoid-associated protein YgaU
MLILLLTGCSSKPETPEQTPEIAPVEKAVVPEEKTEPVETPQKEVVGEDEIRRAEDAIEKAEKAGAGSYSPELFLAANEDLEKAKSMKSSNPDRSRTLLASSIEKAEKAYEQSINAQVEQKIAKLRILESMLKDIEAERFMPEEYRIVQARADQLILYLNQKDYENADKQYSSTLRAMQNLYDTLDKNIRWVKILDRDTTTYIKEAEEQEVFLWAPEELEKANYIYSQGISQFNNYKIKESEKSLKEAKYWAYQSIQLSKQRKRQSETDQLMLDALNTLENASQNRVMEEDGTIIEANPWQGDDYLNENPAPSTEADQFSEDDSSLKEYDPDEAESEDKNAFFLINGVTSVMGDEQRTTLLDQAIELWKQGVKARSEGKFDIADEYFKQSKAYSEAYSANAIANEYIVKKRDTLWAISAKKEILDNPFLWTKIWRRNSKIIENPDLIYPGQKLIIPPK